MTCGNEKFYCTPFVNKLLLLLLNMFNKRVCENLAIVECPSDMTPFYFQQTIISSDTLTKVTVLLIESYNLHGICCCPRKASSVSSF